MNRAQVIQRLLPSSPDSKYLEVGVQHGYTFHEVKAGLKVAVDPHFAFDVAAMQRDQDRSGCRYHQVTSNDYFNNIWNDGELFDVIFLDGLHTFDQTLKDFLNAIRCVKADGVIVVDDVMPVSYASSISDVDRFQEFRKKRGIEDGSWMGDVFKIPFFVKNYLSLYSYATVEENCAQMVIWQARSDIQNDSSMNVEAICRLEYLDFALRPDILNLMPIAEIERLLSCARKT